MSANAQSNPYAPPKAEVADASDAEIVVPAGRGIRLGAALIDAFIGFIIGLPVVIAMVPAMMSGGGDPEALAAVASAGMGGAVALTSLLAIAWIVVTIILVQRNQQTIGKKLVGIKVARSDGSRASLGRIFWLRNVVNALPGMLPFLGYLYTLVDHLFIFGEKRQCIHDKIADTIVVKA